MPIPLTRHTVFVENDHSLSIRSEPLGNSGAGDLLIRVRGIGVNRGDLLQRKGLYPPPPDAPPILGLEVSGEVVSTGSGVETFRQGDRVCALTHGGGYSDYAYAPAAHTFPVPDTLDLVSAAALPEAVFTVWHNVFQRCALQPGESLLVHGGASGIGTLAIQMATAFGARVYATAGSDAKCRACESLGAVQAINYRTDDFVTALSSREPRGIDVILDMAGGDFIPKNIQLAAPDGRIVSIALVRGGKAEINFAAVLMKRLTLTASTLRAQSMAQKSRMAQEILQHVWPKLEAGILRPVVDRVYAFKEVEAAHQYMSSGAHIGKILLRTDPTTD